MLIPLDERNNGETLFDKLVRHYKVIVIDNKIPLSKLLKKVGKQSRGRTIDEISVPNIQELIEQHNLDPDYNLYLSKQNFTDRARHGKLGEREVQQLLAWGIVTEEQLIPLDKREKNRRAENIIKHCKALADRNIDITNLQLMRQQTALELYKLDIENIEGIIEEDRLDRNFILREAISWLRKEYSKGTLTEEETRVAENIPRITYKEDERTKVNQKRRNGTGNCIL